MHFNTITLSLLAATLAASTPIKIPPRQPTAIATNDQQGTIDPPHPKIKLPERDLKLAIDDLEALEQAPLLDDGNTLTLSEGKPRETLGGLLEEHPLSRTILSMLEVL